MFTACGIMHRRSCLLVTRSPGGKFFESRPTDCLSKISFSWFYLTLDENCRIVWNCNTQPDHLLPHSCYFITFQSRINCLVDKYRINLANECIQKAHKVSREFQEAIFSSIQKGRRGRRCKQLLDNFKENRKCWDMRGEALDSK